MSRPSVPSQDLHLPSSTSETRESESTTPVPASSPTFAALPQTSYKPTQIAHTYTQATPWALAGTNPAWTGLLAFRHSPTHLQDWASRPAAPPRHSGTVPLLSEDLSCSFHISITHEEEPHESPALGKDFHHFGLTCVLSGLQPS